MSYEEQEVHLQLDFLANRRYRVDLLMAFKALRGGLRIDANTIGLQLAASNTRSNGSNLVTCRTVNNNFRKTCEFCVRKSWNSLSSTAKPTQSLTVFKKCI